MVNFNVHLCWCSSCFSPNLSLMKPFSSAFFFFALLFFTRHLSSDCRQVVSFPASVHTPVSLSFLFLSSSLLMHFLYFPKSFLHFFLFPSMQYVGPIDFIFKLLAGSPLSHKPSALPPFQTSIDHCTANHNQSPPSVIMCCSSFVVCLSCMVSSLRILLI